MMSADREATSRLCEVESSTRCADLQERTTDLPECRRSTPRNNTLSIQPCVCRMGDRLRRRRKTHDRVARSPRPSCDRDHDEGEELSHAKTARKWVVRRTRQRNDRVGCPRSDDRPAAQGLLSADCKGRGSENKKSRGCGNDAPDGNQRTISTGAWKSR